MESAACIVLHESSLSLNLNFDTPTVTKI